MLQDTTCCGLDEIDGLEATPEETLLRVSYEKYDDEGWGGTSTQAFILFTDKVSRRRGQRLCEYIEKNGLGEVVKTKARRNPNSGNTIKVWVWAPNERALKKWWRKNRKDIDDSYGY